MRCPNCGKEYTPDKKYGDKTSSPIQREQHITGICSDKCWDDFLGGSK